MSSTRPISEKQQGQHNQQQENDPKRMGNNPIEPQKNERDSRNQQSQKDRHDSQQDKQPSR
jgi:hypothetical protein